MANSFTVMSNMNTIGKNDGAMLLTLRNVSLFPFVLTPVFVDEKEAVERMRKAYDGNRLVAFFQEIGDDFPEFVKRHPDCRIRTVRWQDKEITVHAQVQAQGFYEKQGFVYTGNLKFDHLPFTSGYMEWKEIQT